MAKKSIQIFNIIMTILIIVSLLFLEIKVLSSYYPFGRNFLGIILNALLNFFAIYFGMLLTVIIHETGHLIAGKFSGFEFISFRIGNIILINDNGKLKLKKFMIPGTGGQCLMNPPESPRILSSGNIYLLGGIIANLIFTSFSILVYFSSENIPLIRILSIFFIFWGIWGLIQNGIPLEINGIPNDMKHFLLLQKNPQYYVLIFNQLRIMNQFSAGIPLKEIPSQWFSIPENADMNNSIVCQIAYFKFIRSCDLHDLPPSKKMAEDLLKEGTGLTGIQKNELLCHILFCEIMGECRTDEINKLLTKDLQIYIKNTGSYPVRKTLMYAYELLYQKNMNAADLVLKEFEEIVKVYPYRMEIDEARETIQMIQAKNVPK